jgi:hypothetical protein
MSEVEMGRISVMLPVETIRQIDLWAGAAGVKRSQFVSMALAIGSRVLARQTSPEEFLTVDQYRVLAQALGVDAGELQRRMGAEAVK